jgi:hypothetical protein
MNVVPGASAMPHFRRLAFAKRELLVLIAIFIVGMMVLLPAVQRMREHAACEKCQNNLKQIALACQNYESSFGHLPPGGIESPFKDTGDGQTFLGCIPFIISYLECEDVFRHFDTSDESGIKFDADAQLPKGTKPWYENETNLQLARYRFPMLHCPSDDAYSSPFVFSYLFAGNDTMNSGFVASSYANLGRTNYMPCAGSIGRTETRPYGQYFGVFTDRSKTRLDQICDGTAATFLFGEYLGDYSKGPRTYAASWMGAGSCGTAYGLPDPGYQAGGEFNFGWITFNSKHPGIIHFAMADGSVYPVRKGVGAVWFSTDWYNLQRAGGMQDGEVLFRASVCTD